MREDLDIEFVYLVNEILSNKNTVERIYREKGFTLITALISLKYDLNKNDDFIYDISDINTLMKISKYIKSHRLITYLGDISCIDFNATKQSTGATALHYSSKSQLSCLGQIDKNKIIKKKLSPELLDLFYKFKIDDKYKQKFHKIEGYVFENAIYDVNLQIITLFKDSIFYTYKLKEKEKNIHSLRPEYNNKNKILNIFNELNEDTLKKLLKEDLFIEELKDDKNCIEELIKLNYLF